MTLRETFCKENLLKHWLLFTRHPDNPEEVDPTAPFRYIDNLNAKFTIRDKTWDLNILKEDEKLRKVMLYGSYIITIMWALTGFDGGIGQVEWPLMMLLTGQAKTLPDLTYWYYWAYGKYTHWSAFTIYGLGFWYLSRHYAEKLNIHGSRNAGYAFSFILLSVSIFEWGWMISFYVFQGQTWILKWVWPQLRILMQNTGFMILGLLCIIHLLVETKYKLGLSKRTLALTGCALGCWLLWWYYPLPVHTFTVETATGLWSNSFHFPQTVYTIDLDPLDAVNAGTQFYFENDLVHFVNTIAKVFTTLAVMSLGMLGGEPDE